MTVVCKSDSLCAFGSHSRLRSRFNSNATVTNDGIITTSIQASVDRNRAHMRAELARALAPHPVLLLDNQKRTHDVRLNGLGLRLQRKRGHLSNFRPIDFVIVGGTEPCDGRERVGFVVQLRGQERSARRTPRRMTHETKTGSGARAKREMTLAPARRRMTALWWYSHSPQSLEGWLASIRI